MKYLVVFGVVMFGFWLWSSRRTAAKVEKNSQTQAKKSSATQKSQSMLPCAVCGVHLPQSDTLAGRDGVYCSQAHKTQAEG